MYFFQVLNVFLANTICHVKYKIWHLNLQNFKKVNCTEILQALFWKREKEREKERTFSRIHFSREFEDFTRIWKVNMRKFFQKSIYDIFAQLF